MNDCDPCAPKEMQTPQSLHTRSLEKLTLLEAADFLRAKSQGETFTMLYMAVEAPFAHDGMIGGDEFIESHLELPRALGLHAPFWARITDYRDGTNVIYTTEKGEGIRGVMGILLYPDGDAPGDGHKYWRAFQAQSGTDTTERNYLYYSMRWKQTWHTPVPMANGRRFRASSETQPLSSPALEHVHAPTAPRYLE
jgi:hypothetical protein